MGTITARSPNRQRAGGGLLAVPVVTIVALCVLALAFVTYVLRPRLEATPAALDAPALPIVVADTLFRVPPRALRVALQRRPGTQERLDLVFFWPAMTPAADPSEDDLAASAGRIFVTIAPNDGVASPAERLKSIYPRHLARTVNVGPDGLSAGAFLDDTPYQGEDLLFDETAPDRFLVRCTRDKRATAGSCLYERNVGQAVITLRFPRTLLAQWRTLVAATDRLLTQLQATTKHD
jgi:hypothetical protein